MHRPTAPSGEQFELVHANEREVVVEVGGGLRTYSAAGRDLLDGYALDAPSTSGRGRVLSPWPNRLEDGSYEFDGRRHQFALTEYDFRRARPVASTILDNCFTDLERDENGLACVVLSDPEGELTLTL